MKKEKGSVVYHKQRGYYYVSIYWKGKARKIYKRNGSQLRTRSQAEDLLRDIRSDIAQGTFSLAKYTQTHDYVHEYLWTWLSTIQHTLAPATQQSYSNYIKHLVRFFKPCRLRLRDVKYPILMELVKELPLKGVAKMNCVYVLHACLKFAWRSGLIDHMEPFPEKKDYQIEEKPIEWLHEKEQLDVLDHIPEQHQCIFAWLKYTLRRPGEACALYLEDFKDGVFTVHRTLSNGKVRNKTKSGEIYKIPCPNFLKPHIVHYFKYFWPEIDSPFFFINPRALKDGKPYSHDALDRIWRTASRTAGVMEVRKYVGLRHSSISQFLNEGGYDVKDVQLITGHKDLAALKKYMKLETPHKKKLLDGHGGSNVGRKRGQRPPAIQALMESLEGNC
jgi:integrase